MDVGRDYQHVGRIYPFHDAPGVWVEVLWVPVPLDTPAIRYPNPFVLRNWDRLEELDQTELGTDQTFAQYYYGPTPPLGDGHPTGSADEWLNGLSYAKYLSGGYTDPCPEADMPNFVSSFRSPDGSLTVNHPTGDVTCIINVGHANTWTAPQIFKSDGMQWPFVVQDPSGLPMFGIGASGQINTNQTDTDPLPATTPIRLAVYDDAGVLLGYAPVYPPPPPDEGVLDDFIDSDGTLLEDHVPAPINTPNQPWEVYAGTWEIEGNKLVKTAHANTHEVCAIDVGSADGTVTVDLQVPVGGGYTGVAVRSPDNDNGWYVELSGPGQQLILYEVSSGSFTTRDVQALTLVNGTTYTVAVELNGTTITATCDGVVVTYGSATAFQTVTKHGLRCYTGNSDVGPWGWEPL